jgi:hypothetical protein
LRISFLFTYKGIELFSAVNNAEIDSETQDLCDDPEVLIIISDGALFLVTTEDNSINYRLDFEPPDMETLREYGVKMVG